MKKRIFAIILIIILMAMLLPLNGCRRGEPQSISIALGGQPMTVDPQRADDQASLQMVNLLYEGLVIMGEEGLKMGAAEDYKVTDDGLKYVFTLRKGLKWSDGEELTAQQYKDGLLRTLNPANNNANAQQFLHIQNAAAYYAQAVDQDGKPVKVLFDGDEPMQDDYYNYIPDENGRYISVKNDGTPYTAADVGIKAEGRKLTITLDKPMPQLLSLLTLASAMPYRSQTEDKSVNTLVNGPWKIGQWVEGKSISLVRNEEYRMKTDITDIECVPVTREAAIGLVKSGDIDLSVLPRGTSVQMDFDWIQTGRQVDGTVLYLQLKQSAVENQTIRQQLSGALDREELSATVAGYPATGVIPDNVYSFENSLRAGVTEYPILVPGNQGVSEVDLELILAINNGSAEESDMADAIQRELLDALGVTVMIESASFGDINHMLDEGKCNAVFGSVGPYMSADEYLNAFTDGAAETGNYSVREQQIISDALYIPLTFGTFDYAYHSKLSGVAFRHDGVVTLTEAKLS